MDKIVSGGLAGLISGIVVGVLISFLHGLGLTGYNAVNIAGGVFMQQVLVNPSPVWLAIGWAAHLVISVTSGVILAALLNYSGFDYAVLKGIMFGGLLWLFSFGVVAPLLGYTLLPLLSPLDLLVSFFRHLLFGALASALYAAFRRPALLK